MKSLSTNSDATKRSLAIGIPATGGYKETMLTYSGLPKTIVPTVAEGIKQGLRVFVWNQDDFLTTQNSDRIVVITSHGFLAKTLGLNIIRNQSYHFRVNQPPLSRRSFYVNIPCDTLPGQETVLGTCYDSGDQPIKDSGIIILESGNVLFISMPWDILDIHMGPLWERRPFYSSFVKKHFVETGPSIDFGAMRRLFTELILCAFRHLDLPLIRQRHPLQGRSTFCFKVDGDGFSKASTESVLRISKALGNKPFSWFIDVQGWGKNLSYIKLLMEEKQDIELHCYHHMTYQSKQVNLSNYRMGIRRLVKYCGRPPGVAAPFGFWFPGHQEAVKDLHFDFSSELGFNVDDLPSFPYNDPSYPLQIPQHAASIGIFEKCDFNREETFIHLKGVMEEAVRDRGWAIIYDHPLHRIERYEQEFITLFKSLLDNGFSYLNLTDYAGIARAFLLHEFHPFIHNDTLHIEETNPGAYSFEVFPGNGTRLLTGNHDVVVGQLSQIEDEFIYPPSPVFDTIASMRVKNADLTALSLPGWHYALARVRIKQLLKTIKRTVSAQS